MSVNFRPVIAAIIFTLSPRNAYGHFVDDIFRERRGGRPGTGRESEITDRMNRRRANSAAIGRVCGEGKGGPRAIRFSVGKIIFRVNSPPGQRAIVKNGRLEEQRENGNGGTDNG